MEYILNKNQFFSLFKFALNSKIYIFFNGMSNIILYYFM
jgi:hypothetical protein